MTYVAAPADEFHRFRADPEGAVLRSLDLAGDLGERVRAGERAERVYGDRRPARAASTPRPGRAGRSSATPDCVMDPITGQGIADAFRDAELLAAAVAGDLSFDDYRERRDAAALPMYEMTAELASLAPLRPDGRLVFEALEGRPEEVQRFLGVLCGASPPAEFFGPRSLLRLLGPRKLLKAGRARRKMAA